MKRTISCLIFALLVFHSLSFAQPQYPSINGSVADGASNLERYQVQAAADLLEDQFGAEVIALTVSTRGNLSFEAYIETFLELNGLQDSSTNLFDDRLILIAIDYTPDDRGIVIFYGNSFSQDLDPDIQQIQDDVIAPNALRNPTRAMTDGLAAITSALQESRTGTAPPATTQENVNGSSNDLIWKLLVLAIGAALILFFMLRIWPAYQRRKEMIEDIKKMRLHGSKEYSDLKARLGSTANENPTFSQLQAVLKEERPFEYEELAEGFEHQKSSLASSMEQAATHDEKPVNLLTDESQLSFIKKAYRTLSEERDSVDRWLKKIEALSHDLKTTADSTETVLDQFKEKLRDGERRYLELANHSPHLPEYSKASASLVEERRQALKVLNDQRPFSAQKMSQLIRNRYDLLFEVTEAFTDLEKIVIQRRSEAGALVVQNPEQMPSEEDLFELIPQHLENIATLIANGKYEAALEEIDLTESDLEDLVLLLELFLAAVGEADERVEAIKAHQQDGFSHNLNQLIESTEVARASVNQALKEGNLELAESAIDEFENISRFALKEIETLRSIFESNHERIDALESSLNSIKSYKDEVVEPLWEELQTGYHPANWSEFGTHFEQASAVIESFLGKEEERQSLVAQMSELNNFKDERCEIAEQMLTEAETELKSTQLVLEQLAAHHERVVEAEQNHLKIFKNARIRLDSARDLRDREDQFIDSEVDNLIEESTKALHLAEESISEQIFIDVIGFSQDSLRQSDEALSRAESQISEISNLITQKEQAKGAARQAIDQVKIQIGEASGIALQPMTLSQLERASETIKQAGHIEIKALAQEDQQMKQLLAESVDSYQGAKELAEAASVTLVEDITSYATLLANASTALQLASDEIADAKVLCRDYRASMTAKKKLNQAKEALPKPPEPEATRESLNRVISKANESKELASRAAAMANSSIRNYVDYSRYDDRSDFSIWSLFDDDGGYSGWGSSSRSGRSSWGRSSGRSSGIRRSSSGGSSRRSSSSSRSFGSSSRTSKTRF